VWELRGWGWESEGGAPGGLGLEERVLLSEMLVYGEMVKRVSMKPWRSR
jgi:hypothetical protein